MKRILFFLIVICFNKIKAQSPALSYTNVTGSNSITCSHPNLNYIASVSNYTNGPLTYTWISMSATASGTNVTLSGAGSYTLTAFNTSNSFSISQTFTVYTNQSAPQISASAANGILTCNTPSTLLQGTSTSSNVSFNWSSSTLSQFPHDTLTVFTTANTSNTVVGTYTLMVTDTLNGCNSYATVTVYQNIMPPNAIITGSTTVSCTSTITLTNASTSNVPPAFFPTLPVIGYIWYGPSPQASVSNSSSYQAYTPGTYTLIALDLNNGCKSSATKLLSGTGVYPQVSSGTFSINCPTPSVSIYPVVTGNITGFTYSWAAPANATVSSLNTATIATNSAGVYTITVTNQSGCSTTTFVTVTSCTGIKQDNLFANDVVVFPNPNNGIFNIELVNQLQTATIEIYSITGNLVKKQSIVSGKTQVFIQNEPAGLYFIRFFDGGNLIKTVKIEKL